MISGTKREKKYSVWLMPAGYIARELRKLIVNLSKKHMTDEFQPHVTLIGELKLHQKEAIRSTKELARKIVPIEIKLGKITYLEQYYRCVFAKAQKTQELKNAYAAACRAFKQKPGDNFLPHLSLVYGELNEQTKRSIITDIGNKLDITFTADNLYLYYTGGQPEDWYCILRSPLDLYNV